MGTLGPGSINEGGSRGTENQNAASAKQGTHCSFVLISSPIDQYLMFFALHCSTLISISLLFVY